MAVITKKQVQDGAIEILQVFQEHIQNNAYTALQKAIKNDLIVSTFAKMDINAWNRVTGDSFVATEALYQHFKEYRYIFETKTEQKETEKKETEKDVKGFKTVYITTLPVHKGSDEQHHRHSTKPLHLKTN
eukprot:430182_1